MKTPLSPSQADGLASRLAACKLTDLATSLSADPQTDAIWKDFPDPAPYALLLEDPARPDAVRFAAALVLRSKSAAQLRKVKPQALAQALATALKKDLAGFASPWGWLWAPGDPVGHLGRIFLELGRPALPALVALLDDTTPRDIYLGSEEATEMAMRKYRVKDFAAFYVARIVGQDLPWEADLGRRDAAIARLHQHVLP